MDVVKHWKHWPNQKATLHGHDQAAWNKSLPVLNQRPARWLVLSSSHIHVGCWTVVLLVLVLVLVGGRFI